jgi:hypothetical protein
VIPGRIWVPIAAKSKLILIRYVAPPSYFATHCPICSRDFPFSTLAGWKDNKQRIQGTQAMTLAFEQRSEGVKYMRLLSGKRKAGDRAESCCKIMKPRMIAPLRTGCGGLGLQVSWWC